MVFQDYALFPHLTVLENVAFGLDGRAGVPRPERRARAQALLERVELGDRAGSYPHVLSGGEQQRVALARALAPQPAVMLLDEPFQGLDTRLRQRIRDDTLRLLHQSGAAVLLVTHDPEEAMAMGDRLAVLRQGRVQQEGRPGAVYDHPATPFVARFLGDTNSLPGLVKGGAVETPLGPLPAPERSEGEPVEVLLRPESLILEGPLDPADGGPASRNGKGETGALAVVEGVRRVGAQTLIEVRLQGSPTSPTSPTSAEEGGAALRAARLGPCDLAPGDRVRVRFDRLEALVFPSG
jgi:iron(III) transport system ATP-binding protein